MRVATLSSACAFAVVVAAAATVPYVAITPAVSVPVPGVSLASHALVAHAVPPGIPPGVASDQQQSVLVVTTLGKRGLFAIIGAHVGMLSQMNCLTGDTS